MIGPRDLLALLHERGVRFFAGVPDSTLAGFGQLLADHVPPDRHVVAANEGGAVALAAGYHLATGEMGCVYLQNSGLGNAVNPLISLTAPDVYAIPVLLIVGWRGEPPSATSAPDEPQHLMQGRITLDMLRCLEIEYAVLGPDEPDPVGLVSALVARGRTGSRPVALVVRRGVLEASRPQRPTAHMSGLTREDALRAVVAALPADATFVATTGKVSRELYEHRCASGADPSRDFLTVGSMGHALQIAVGVALARPDQRVVCIDGDGALLMHMGGLATSATAANLVHVVMNNGGHESAGGAPSRGLALDMPGLARACGYVTAARCDNRHEIGAAIAQALQTLGSTFIEIRTVMASRLDLGRPTVALQDAKCGFMRQLRERPVA